MTFEQRVEAQRAIERVYYAHQIGASLPFDEAVPRAVLEDKVRASLRQSEALRDLWNTPITGEALRSEVERIAAQTRFPDRLREIYAALGNDAFLVQETLGRATLAARLTRNFYARDERLHDATRREAEDLRDDLVRGKIEPSLRHRRQTVVEARRSTDGGGPRPLSGIVARPPGDETVRLDMAPEEFDRWRATLPEAVGSVGAVEESRDGFTVSVLLAEGPGWARASTWSILKRPWESFLSDVADRYDESKVEVVASPAATLPGAAAPAPDCVPEDTWSDTTTGNAPMARHDHTAVWTGSQMIIWGGAVGTTWFHLKTGGRYDPLTDTWLPTSTVNAPTERDGHTAIWTGNRMVVWGGLNCCSYPAIGGRYDPIADEWTPTSTDGAPPARQEHSAVWTGSRMIVWGGDGPGTSNTGGSYDPVADTWTTVSLTGAPEARSRHRAVWTGGTMVVWGGVNGSTALNSGGRYNPANDTWAPTSLLDAPQPRTSFVAVWTGSEMVVWGGHGSGGVGLNTGGRYDPVSDLWRSTRVDATTPPGVSYGTAVWSGTEMIVWGGGFVASPGGRYDPVADTWSPVATAGAPSYRFSHSAVWTGGRMIVWGGTGSADFRTGGRYDPVSNTWTPTSAEYVPAPVKGHTALWTGNLMLVWGGSANPVIAPRHGRYDPTLDTWTGISATGPYDARVGHSAVWTGLEMIVWGGSGNGYRADGGRYNPLTDSWILIPTPFTSDPAPRSDHTAVWTGQRMIVFGGRGNNGQPVTFGDGWAFNLEDTIYRWIRINPLNAPSARYGHSAVWTGTQMLIWGSTSDSSGGLYEPVADAWTPMSLVDAPSPRTGQAVVWTGEEMIVWGGRSTITPLTCPEIGGRYDPSTDTWRALPSAGVPPGRETPTAVWTGKEMIVWGGVRNITGSVLQSSGGRYAPASDAWSPVSSVAAPVARNGHTAVWSGRFMIVWGGATSTAPPWTETASPFTDTGGLYAIGDSSDYDGDGLTVCGGDCDDIDPATHPGAVEICDGKDSDCDGALPQDEADSDGDLRADCSDCRPFDASAFAAPGMVSNVRAIWTIPWQWQWDSLTSSTGTGTAYDVFHGSLSALRGSGGDFATGACLSSAQFLTRVEISPTPAEGDGFYIIVRGRNACGVGSYGTQPRDTGASLSPAACP